MMFFLKDCLFVHHATHARNLPTQVSHLSESLYNSHSIPLTDVTGIFDCAVACQADGIVVLGNVAVEIPDNDIKTRLMNVYFLSSSQFWKSGSKPSPWDMKLASVSLVCQPYARTRGYFRGG